jgi:protein TonB
MVELLVPDVTLPDPPPDPVTATTPAVVPPTAVPGAGSVPRQVADVAYSRPPAPRYPPEAKRARAQGLVLLRVLIDAQGRAAAVSVHRSSGHAALDDAARAAVLAALFKPYEENGVARSAEVIVPIEFSLAIRTASSR